jgi:hypothetical protein
MGLFDQSPQRFPLDAVDLRCDKSVRQALYNPNFGTRCKDLDCKGMALVLSNAKSTTSYLRLQDTFKPIIIYVNLVFIIIEA